MESIQNLLKNVRVKNAILMEDSLIIKFSDDSSLCVYNSFDVIGGKIQSIIGKKIFFIIESEREIIFNFSGNISLIVSLEDQDFHGPEAMLFTKEGIPPVVWS